MTPGQIVPLTIEKPAAGGRMIARLDGRIVLVSGAIPGERVRARVERVTRGVAYAETVAVEEASPDRREPPVDPACGGSLFSHIDAVRQLALKGEILADACARIGRFSAPLAGPVHASPFEGYRMRARLHVKDGRAGFFREGSHALCDARGTRQLLPATTDTLDALLDRLSPEVAAAIHELEISENIPGDGRAIHLVLSKQARPPLGEPALPEAITGLSWSDPAQAGVTVAAGSPFVVDALEVEGQTVALRRHVLSFFQGNRFLIGGLVAHVLDRIEPGASVFDLYAGVGVFALPLATLRKARVTAVEGERFSSLDLQANADAVKGQVAVVRQSVESFLGKARPSPDVVVVDPPRTGLSPEAVAGVSALAAPRLVYVSCDVATLARDARRLIDQRYTCDVMEAFDMFPNTPHVETVAVFRRT